MEIIIGEIVNIYKEIGENFKKMLDEFRKIFKMWRILEEILEQLFLKNLEKLLRFFFFWCSWSHFELQNPILNSGGRGLPEFTKLSHPAAADQNFIFLSDKINWIATQPPRAQNHRRTRMYVRIIFPSLGN